ncbi:MAG TPA: M13 family metallopeptidase [Vulgatibacter sp.]|nr:M13 family metallopeptidase [Vulgatibacter sp.]
MRTHVLFPILAASLATLSACRSAGPKPAQAVAEVQRSAPPLPEMEVDAAAMDPAVDPCTDFYAYACGGWMKQTPIPPDRPAWYRSFSEIQAHNELLLRRILDDVAGGRLQTPYGDELGAFWSTCMDEADAPAASLATLREELGRIEAARDSERLAAEVARLQMAGVNAFFSFGAQQDFRDATQVIGVADQGGLGLPDRGYYLDPGERPQATRTAYVAHVARMLELAGETPESATRSAQAVMEIETALAEASMPRVDRRDPYNIYHRIDRQGLEAAAPNFDWRTYFEGIGEPDVEKINVTVPAFFRAFSQLLGERDPAQLRTYLRWHLVRAAAPALPEAFVQEDFAFRSKQLTGEERILPRWKRCVAAVDAAMGEALARPFVAIAFGEEGKARAQELVKQIEAAFERNLQTLGWMDEPTRSEALQKLHAVYNKIGYPERWRSYDGLEVSDTSYLANRLAAERFESKRQLDKIGEPVDRSEWFMSPPTVNAYYNPLLNEMVFPAGILQAPFFGAEAEPAANAGAIGMVMGHELTHGFDDKGRQFDAKGNLREWWTPAVSDAYREKAQCVVDQYAAYEVQDLNLDGNLTLGENIADIGGLKMSWLAFSHDRADLDVRDDSGFSPAQRFFIAYAQSWCANRRPEYARLLVTVDPHSPPEFRVNGAVINQVAFQEAFACQDGAPMAPVDRCEVW